MRVSGEGPLHPEGGLMLVGEGPGAKESETGVPFHPDAPAGAELTRYLNGHLLPYRSEVYITNLVKEWPEGAKKKKQDVTPADIARDEWELRTEIAMVRPTVIASLGRWSSQYLLGGLVSMDACHGLVFQRYHCGMCGRLSQEAYCTACGELGAMFSTLVVPVVHPAAGLHQPELAARTAYDLNILSQVLKGDYQVWKPGKTGVYFEAWAAMAGPKERIGVDTEGLIGSLWCLSLSVSTGTGAVIKPYLLPNEIKNGDFHNYMWDQQVLQAAGVVVDEDTMDDTMVMAYLLNEPQALKDLAFRFLGLSLPEFKDVCGHWEDQLSSKTGKKLKKQKFVLGTLDDINPQLAINYAGTDADITRQVAAVLRPRIHAANLDAVYQQERGMLPVYARMEHVGLPISTQHFAEFQKDLQDDLDLRTFMLQAEWPSLNPASADQVAQVLFDHLKLPGAKLTPSGKRPSTNDKILQSLKYHPAVQAIIDWREVSKLKGTFVDNLPKYCRPAQDGRGTRLHFRLLPTRTATRRPAAKDPNVLALPKHSALGQRFRRGIRAEPGRLLGSWDFDQIELRVLALDSGSSTLREIFVAGQDLHARTAQKIFGVPASQQDKSAHRLPAKAVNFGIPMGMTEMGLAEQMRKNGYPWPELVGGWQHLPQKKQWQMQADVCRAWIEAVIAEWHIGPYLEEKKAQARRWGYVTDLWGHRRYLPMITSTNKMLRLEAERQTQSFPIQAGARGFYKQTVIRVWKEVIKPLRMSGTYIEPLLDIHDDLLLEFDADCAGWLLPLVDQYFNNTSLPVPITAKGSCGVEWAGL